MSPMNLVIRVSNSNGPFSTPMSQPAPRPWVDVSYIASSPFGYDIARSSISKNEPEWEDMHFKVYKRQAAYRKSKHTCGHCGGWGLRMCSALPVWDDILTPLYIDPGVNISYDILTPGSIYRNDILTPLTIFWPPLPIVHKTVLMVMTNC